MKMLSFFHFMLLASLGRKGRRRGKGNRIRFGGDRYRSWFVGDRILVLWASRINVPLFGVGDGDRISRKFQISGVGEAPQDSMWVTLAKMPNSGEMEPEETTSSR